MEKKYNELATAHDMLKKIFENMLADYTACSKSFSECSEDLSRLLELINAAVIPLVVALPMVTWSVNDQFNIIGTYEGIYEFRIAAVGNSNYNIHCGQIDLPGIDKVNLTITELIAAITDFVI